MNKLRQIVAHFLKVAPSDINDATKIDYKSFASSLMLHRMYAKLHAEGYSVADLSIIATFADLSKQLIRHAGERAEINNSSASVPALNEQQQNDSQELLQVGVDTELIEQFDYHPDVTKDEFYKNTFSPNEIEYCIRQRNPRASFVGLFSLKESIVKADNSLIGKKFNKIEISHSAQGRPIYPGFSLSVSHSDVHVVSVAIKSAR